MAKLVVEQQTLVVRLNSLEKLAALRGDVRVPLAVVVSVEAEPHPWQAVRGIRAPGTGVPGLLAYSIRRCAGGKDLVALVAGRPAVRMKLDDASPFARLVVSTRDAEAAAATVRAAVERVRGGG